MSEQDRLAQAVELVKAGNHAEAQQIVAEVIRADTNNARAWILMAKIVDDPERALQCWQEVARLKPDDPRVQEEIAQLKGEAVPQTQSSARPPSDPTVQSSRTQLIRPITPAEQKKKIPLPLLIGGGVAIVAVVALVITIMTKQPAPGYQAATAGAATIIAEGNTPTDIPDPATTVGSDSPAGAPTVAVATMASSGTTPQSNSTHTPEPDASAPTGTPESANTQSAPTDKPASEPIILTGEGDSVQDITKWDGPALAHITYTGIGNFNVGNYGANGEQIDLLVNVVGGFEGTTSYEGTRPIDFVNLLEPQQTVRFQIQAQGPWTIEILPLTQIRHVTIPGTFEGKGDDVVFMDGNNPDVLKIDASKAASNFAIWEYVDWMNLLVNEIAPYEGTVTVGKDTAILVIKAEGNWTIKVTTK